jgi:hypothetical protein
MSTCCKRAIRPLPQPARRDPVFAALVFLDLLTAEAKLFGQVLLAHADLPPTDADTLPDLDVEAIGTAAAEFNTDAWKLIALAPPRHNVRVQSMTGGKAAR